MSKKYNKLSTLIYQTDKDDIDKPFGFMNFNDLEGQHDVVTVKLSKQFSNRCESKIVGRGYNIANALRHGFHTDIDIAKDLYCSKRTIDRLMHPRKIYKYSGYNRLTPHFKNTIKIYNLYDDYFYHYKDVKSKRTSRGFGMGKWKPKTVVDNVTLTQYIRYIKSPLSKKLHNKYANKTKSQVIKALYDTKINAFRKSFKYRLMIKYLKEYTKQSDSNQSFREFLNGINFKYINMLASTNNRLHDKWTFPVLSLLYMSDPQYLVTVSKMKHLRTWDAWKKFISTHITEPTYYINLYNNKKYRYLIPKSKRVILHYVYQFYIWYE